jgi:adenosylcobinamide-phosphate synthase
VVLLGRLEVQLKLLNWDWIWMEVLLGFQALNFQALNLQALNFQALDFQTPKFQAIALLVGAALLDYGIGDPWGWPHPVQFMGWAIARGTKLALIPRTPYWQRITGTILGLGLILASGLAGWGIANLTLRLHPLLGWGVSTILLASCFAGRSLRAAAEEVLGCSEITTARSHLARYVGRDTADLSQPEILRAVLETVAENATDGVFAPLFYALLGSFLPHVGPLPLALAYKAASTLDSMVGYRTEPYTHIGWFSAKLEDALTWLPCRLHVLCIALLSGRPGEVLAICRRDGPPDPSPNSGWSEAAYAAALGVQLGGANTYQGVVRVKPLVGDATRAIAPATIHQALRLMRASFLLLLGGGLAWQVLR